MNSFKNIVSQILKEVSEKLSKRKDIVSLIIFIGIALVFLISYYFWGNHVVEAMGITAGIVWVVLILLIMLIAGFTVLKSLFLFAGELSLTIFLGQSYCSAQWRSSVSDEALRDLLVVAFLYIIVSFGRSLWGALKEYYKRVKKERWSIAKIFAILLFLIFIVWFLREIYLVVSPIILNLCVYN